MGKELAYEEAVKECKELWKTIQELDTTKGKFINSTIGKELTADYKFQCPLCEYAQQRMVAKWGSAYKNSDEKRCRECPLQLLDHTGMSDSLLCIDVGYDESRRTSEMPTWMQMLDSLPDTQPKSEDFAHRVDWVVIGLRDIQEALAGFGAEDYDHYEKVINKAIKLLEKRQ